MNLDPSAAAGCEFARDVRGVGHQGTGDLQLRVQGPEQMEKAKELAARAYRESLRL